jgi:hypothetical protein
MINDIADEDVMLFEKGVGYGFELATPKTEELYCLREAY